MESYTEMSPRATRKVQDCLFIRTVYGPFLFPVIAIHRTSTVASLGRTLTPLHTAEKA